MAQPRKRMTQLSAGFTGKTNKMLSAPRSHVFHVSLMFPRH